MGPRKVEARSLEVEEMGVQSTEQEKVTVARPPVHRGCNLRAGASALRTYGRQKDRDLQEAVRSEEALPHLGPGAGLWEAGSKEAVCLGDGRLRARRGRNILRGV